MANFCFSSGINAIASERLRQAASFLWGAVTERSFNSFRLFLPAREDVWTFAESETAIGAVAGYVRREDVQPTSDRGDSPDATHSAHFFSEILTPEGWPLTSHWTGSFSAVVHSKSSGETKLCNDPIGPIPLYYAQLAGGVLGSTNMAALSRALQAELDVFGLLQRITPPFCNYGRRTLIRNVSRLLPGECLRFSRNLPHARSVFDNSLCHGAVTADLRTTAETVWDSLKREVTLVSLDLERVGVALSGGWDSRLVLGALTARGAAVDCYTYGSEDHYESRIARRCADLRGASHRCFPIEEKYFPSRNALESLVRATESANFMEWFGMLEAVGQDRVPPLFLGDLCESIVGRYIEEFSSRRARRRSFWKSLLGREDPIRATRPADFQSWKERKTNEIVEAVAASRASLAPALQGACEDRLLHTELRADIEVSFSRVEGNLPPFVPMLDEIFDWFHRVRFLLANQLQFLSASFRPFCPAIGVRFLRLISTVHPALRLRNRLMSAIARLPDFDDLAQVPSAQIPWISARAPAFAREVLWGIRSGLDQMLIRSVLKNRDARRRQRVLPSLDLLQEYQRENVVPTVGEWFSGRWIRGEPYLDLVKNRANLTAWPLINVDIVAPANASITLDLCHPEMRRP